MQDEPDDNHEGEKNVEPNLNRKVRKTEVDGDNVPDTAVRLRGLVEEGDTHRYTNGIGPERRCRFVESSNAYPRNLKHEPPPGTLPSVIDGTEQRAYAVEKQHDDDPYNKPNKRSEYG